MKTIYATFITEGPSPYKGTMSGAYIGMFDSEEDLKEHVKDNRFITSYKTYGSRDEAIRAMDSFNIAQMMMNGSYGFINLYSDGSQGHMYCRKDGLSIYEETSIRRRQITVSYWPPYRKHKKGWNESDGVLLIWVNSRSFLKYEAFEKLSDEHKAIVMEIHDMYVPDEKKPGPW